MGRRRSTSESRTYDEVIFNRRGQPRGRIVDEEAAREMTRKDAERDEVERSSPISLSTHSGSAEEEEEEAPTEKKRRDKEKVLKKKNDAKKKQKLEADKAKSIAENEAREKAEAEEKVVAEKEKESAEASRIATELAAKEATDKVVEEERQKKEVEDKEGDTLPMDLDVPGTSTVGTKTKTTSSVLGLGPWEPFRSTEIVDI
jgi:hypothetical protein